MNINLVSISHIDSHHRQIQWLITRRRTRAQIKEVERTRKNVAIPRARILVTAPHRISRRFIFDEMCMLSTKRHDVKVDQRTVS